MSTSTGSPLPQAPDSERYVLGCIVAFPERAGEVLSGLRPTDFVNPAHQAIFKVFAEQHADGGVDPVLAGRALNAHPAFPDGNASGYLVELKEDVATSAHIPHEAGKIIEARRKRQLASIAESAAEAALNGQPTDTVFASLAADLDDYRREAEATKPRDEFTAGDLQIEYPHLHEPVIDGIGRRGETVNIIGNSKFGKSWLLAHVLLCIIAGRHIFGRFATSMGRCLLIDNELHKPTLAHRIDLLATAMELPPEDYADYLEIWPMRGRLPTLTELEHRIHERVESGSVQAIGFDAMYRFMPPGSKENDPDGLREIYNTLDRIAEHTNALNLVVHHSTKGSQTEKRVTDVGAGSGVQSRAADTHLVLREHEEPDVVVLEAAVRSFAPVEPLALRWAFPLWIADAGINPTMLKGKQTAREQRQSEKDKGGIDITTKALRTGPVGLNELCLATGFGKERQRRLLNMLCANGDVEFHEATKGGQKCHQYTLLE